MMARTKNLFSKPQKKQVEAIALEGEKVRRFYKDLLDDFNSYFGIQDSDCKHEVLEFYRIKRTFEQDLLCVSCEGDSRCTASRKVEALTTMHHGDDSCVNSSEQQATENSENAENSIVARIICRMHDIIPLLEGKQRELFEFHYSLFLLIDITSSEPDPLTAIQRWASIVFPDEALDLWPAQENPYFWVERIVCEIVKNDINSYRGLLAIDGIDNEYFYILTRQYDRIISTSQGLVKLVLLILKEEDVYDGFESVGRNIFRLDWRLSLEYFMYTKKADFFFDLISQRCGLTVDDYSWLYSFRQGRKSPEFLERYIQELRTCREYEKVIEIGAEYGLSVLKEDVIEYCLLNSRVPSLGSSGDKAGLDFLDKCHKLGKGELSDDETIYCLDYTSSPRILSVLFEKICRNGTISDTVLVSCLEKIIAFKESENLRKYRNRFLRMSLE